MVAMPGEQHDFAEQGEIRPFYLLQWDGQFWRPHPTEARVSCPYGCSRVIDTDLSEGIGRNDVVVEEAL